MVQGVGSNGIFSWNNKEGGYGGFSASKNGSLYEVQSNEASNKKIKLTTSDSDEQTKQAETPLLGLTLRKTASFLEFLEMKLSQKSDTNCAADTNHVPNINCFESQPMSEKLKASNFPISYLRIGLFEVKPKYEGDLVAKFYYAKRRLVWEILHEKLKMKIKIEIQWSDILAIRAIIQENEPGILEIELNQPPSFHEENNPQPRRHTNWKMAADFTGGEALTNRRHYLKFPPGALDRHYKKLLQYDNRLLQLSQKPFPSLDSLFFDTNELSFADFSFSFNGSRREISPDLQFPLSCIPTQVHLAEQIHAFESTAKPYLLNKDSTSPISVMDFSPVETISSHGVENPRMDLWGQAVNKFTDISMSDPSGIQVNPIVSCQDYQMLNHNGGARRPDPNNQLLNNIENHLISDNQVVYAESFGSLINLSEELNVVDRTANDPGPSGQLYLHMNDANNNGIKYMGYGENGTTNDHLALHCYGTDELSYSQPICWPSEAQPGNNSASDSRIEDFAMINFVNEINPWA